MHIENTHKLILISIKLSDPPQKKTLEKEIFIFLRKLSNQNFCKITAFSHKEKSKCAQNK